GKEVQTSTRLIQRPRAGLQARAGSRARPPRRLQHAPQAAAAAAAWLPAGAAPAPNLGTASPTAASTAPPGARGTRPRPRPAARRPAVGDPRLGHTADGAARLSPRVQICCCGLVFDLRRRREGMVATKGRSFRRFDSSRLGCRLPPTRIMIRLIDFLGSPGGAAAASAEAGGLREAALGERAP
ncbi:unnamed protein product, partial [Prorocentrum cordatum]